jgi:hypothetical protein
MRILLTALNRWIALLEQPATAVACQQVLQFLTSSASVPLEDLVHAAIAIEDPTEHVTTLQDVYNLSQKTDAMTQMDPLAKLKAEADATVATAGAAGPAPPPTDHSLVRPAAIQLLPAEVLHRIARYLNAKDVSAFRCTCRSLYQTCLYVVPGLKASLFPHQKAALNWMRHREAGGSQNYLHPRFQAIPACAVEGKEQHGSQPVLFLDTDTGDLQQSGDLRRSSLGGLLCDDPGLSSWSVGIWMMLMPQGLLRAWEDRLHAGVDLEHTLGARLLGLSV